MRAGEQGSRGVGESMNGDNWFLTERQRGILEKLAEGYTAKRIALEMGYSLGFVYAEIRGIRAVLMVETDAGAVVEGLRLKVIEL